MHPWEEYQWLPGVLSKDQISQLINNGYIGGVDNFEESSDYSSFDLHISSVCFEMLNGSLKPNVDTHYSLLLNDPSIANPISKNADGYYTLDPGKCYIFELKEHLLPKLANSNIFGQSTAKSSIGRVDVIARLFVDGMTYYEYFKSSEINQGSGKIYLEVIPISFRVCVKEGSSLTQLRLFNGDPKESIITDRGFIKSILHGSIDGEGYLGVETSNTNIINGNLAAAFCANNTDIQKNIVYLCDCPAECVVSPVDTWRFVKSDANKRLVLESNKFYLMRSKERIALPAGVAVYARAMDETLGEMRIHYAGFVHPFFGTDRSDGSNGTPLIFEVRAHSVNVMLADGEKLAKLIFYRMSENAIKDANNPSQKVYNEQELKLSKYFGEWPITANVNDEGSISLT